MKIQLPLITGLPWLNPVVDAELVDVAPHLEWETFAVHRAHREPWNYHVTHVESGFQAGPKARSKEAAIRVAREYLAKKSVEEFSQAVSEAVAKAPWIIDPHLHHEGHQPSRDGPGR